MIQKGFPSLGTCPLICIICGFIYVFISLIFMHVCAENMWGDYMEKGQILEKASLSSVDVHGSMETFGFYVSADIATSFTLLVGIFFPSATGKCPQNMSSG